MLGGTGDYYFGDEKSLKNDIWSSADGKEWRRETAAAPWSPRAYHAAVVGRYIIEEWLLVAEQLLKGGNFQVVLCEQGIRTFEESVRATLDFSAVPILKRLSQRLFADYRRHASPCARFHGHAVVIRRRRDRDDHDPHCGLGRRRPGFAGRRMAGRKVGPLG